MAISGGDGSIILTTKVDTSGMEQGTKSLKSQAAKLAAEYRKAGMSQSEAFKKAWSEIERTRKETEKATKSTQTYGEKAKTAFQGVGSALKSIAGYLALAFSVTKIIQFSNEAGQLATQTEASVQRLADIYGEAAQSVGDFIDANARAIGMSKASAASFASVYGNLFSVWADQNTNAELTNRYLNMTAVVASKTGRTVEDVQERIRSGLLGNTEAIEDLGVFVNVKTIEMTDAFQRMASGKSWEQLDAYTQQQIRSMAILEQATAKYGNTVANTTATVRAQYQAAYEDFQNTWGQVVNEVLIPVLEILTKVFTIATKGLQIIAGLSGKTVENSSQTSNNIKQQTKEQEKLNKAVKKGLASFDEISILTEQSAENTEDIGEGTQISGISGVGAAYDNSFVDQIDADLAAIMGYVGFALAAIGVILICFGHIGWGIGFLIAGAAIFSVSQAALSEGAELEKVKNIMNGVIAGISLLALILGIILVATGGSLPLGIGLIIVGAAGLATEVALNWNYISEAITNFFQKNAGLIVGVSLALIVLGIILLFTGVGIPLAIGLIVAGGGALAATVALNWNFIVDKVKEVWQKVKNFWNSYIAPIFTAKWWADLGKKAINGLISGFEGGINGIIKAFESMINLAVDGINSIGFDIPDWLGGGHFGFNIPRVSFGRVSIPRLAQGAVIPPNREFLAMLGDQKNGVNIETPLSTMVDAFNKALDGRDNTGSQPIHIHLILDSKEIYQAVVEQNKKNARMTGVNEFAF